jgi:hypothetical protein
MTRSAGAALAGLLLAAGAAAAPSAPKPPPAFRLVVAARIAGPVHVAEAPGEPGRLYAANRLLYAGVGDGGYLDGRPNPRNNAQNLGVLLGKIFRVDVSRPDAAPEIVAYGLRNPWRFSFDRVTGDLWIGDVGWNRWEEIDRLPRGTDGLVNLGWSVYRLAPPR